MKYNPEKKPIYGETLESLQANFEQIGQPKFRAKQVLDWLYKKRARSWDDMSNLPKPLRERLESDFDIAPTKRLLAKESADETEKLLLEMVDRSLVETVVIRAPQIGVGQQNSRKTICISTQVGCAYGCKFCASGLAGWKRDLSVGEIVSQLIHVCHLEDATTVRAKEEIASFDNIVVMGMGEPMANYENLLPALRILNAPWGLNFGARRITISTSGIVPRILERSSRANHADQQALSLGRTHSRNSALRTNQGSHDHSRIHPHRRDQRYLRTSRSPNPYCSRPQSPRQPHPLQLRPRARLETPKHHPTRQLLQSP